MGIVYQNGPHLASTQTGAIRAASSYWRTSAPARAETFTVEPGGYFPAMSAQATGVSRSRWIARFTGRAP